MSSTCLQGQVRFGGGGSSLLKEQRARVMDDVPLDDDMDRGFLALSPGSAGVPAAWCTQTLHLLCSSSILWTH
jgi:hypothetical protein